ncbi:MAG: BON domain-containing protein [Cyanobacteria bacterium NC_groundwater_1444_Ag_S-0.65um_54_12]|nr:BON domain-containing protein [Cyanobacteria bacterium NC_groundwater_1444_Ag_S-0.65um_54_12]
MVTDNEILTHVHAVLTRDPRVRDRSEGGAITIFCSGGHLVLAGEVEEIAEKMVPERLVAKVVGVHTVINNLLVKAVPARSDDEIQHHLLAAYAQDHCLDQRQIMPVVADGVVTLTGSVDALAKKRLAGLIAWWAAGVKDVKNQLIVSPAEEDNDDEITDAVRIALEMDKLVDADRIAIGTRAGVVTLRGIARNVSEYHAAEVDAWAVWGVRDVINILEVEGTGC